jgi:colicin import membrane protein
MTARKSKSAAAAAELAAPPADADREAEFAANAREARPEFFGPDADAIDADAAAMPDAASGETAGDRIIADAEAIAERDAAAATEQLVGDAAAATEQLVAEVTPTPRKSRSRASRAADKSAAQTGDAAPSTPTEPTAPKPPKARAPRVGRVEIADDATPAGYLPLKLTVSFAQFRKADPSADGPEWLTKCVAHGTTTEAPNRKAGRTLGAAAQRVTWCKPCKTDAAKAERDRARADAERRSAAEQRAAAKTAAATETATAAPAATEPSADAATATPTA